MSNKFIIQNAKIHNLEKISIYRIEIIQFIWILENNILRKYIYRKRIGNEGVT